MTEIEKLNKKEKRNNKEKKERNKELRLGGFILMSIIIVFALSVIILKLTYTDLQVRALFGDSNGTVNTLFSALAFGGIIFTILLQRKELKLQRKELKNTRKEIKLTTKAHQDSNNFFAEQLRLDKMPLFETKLENLSPGFNYRRLIFKGNSNYSFAFNFAFTIESSNKTKVGSGIYQTISPGKSITVQIPASMYNVELRVNFYYEDILGNNYSQVFHTNYKGKTTDPPRLLYLDNIPSLNDKTFLDDLVEIANDSSYEKILTKTNLFDS